MAAATTEDVLSWEARQAPRAAAAAGASAVLVIGSGIATAALFNNAPVTGLLDSLARAGRPGGVGSLPSLRTPYYEFYDDRAGTVLLTAVARGLGFVAVAFMLVFLGLAVRNRSEGFRRVWIYISLGGGLLGAIATIMFTLGTSAEISTFLSGPRTVDRAGDIGDSSILVTAQLIGIPGTQAIGLASLALGLGWVVICLNAMRGGAPAGLGRGGDHRGCLPVGSTCRPPGDGRGTAGNVACSKGEVFMGVLGIICGALIVLPILSPLPIVQTFWLFAMALLLLGRWPNGVPPAWSTTEALPWPSQQEAREAREARKRGVEPEPETVPEAPVGDGRPHPSSRKKKRKRRT